MHRLQFGYRPVIGGLFTLLVGVLFLGASAVQTSPVFTNPVVQAFAAASAGVSGMVFDSSDELLDDDTVLTQPALAFFEGALAVAGARVEDGVISAEFATEGPGGSASGHGFFIDTFLITSALPAGTLVELLVELEFGAEVSPDDEECVLFSTGGQADALLLAGASRLSITDHTCNSRDDNATGLTTTIQREVGEEFQISLVANVSGGSAEGPGASGSVIARMYVTPLGEADYITASGNDYRRLDDEEPTIEEMLEDLVQTVASLNLQAGISNALDAKLDSARGALADVNENNDVAAINSLNALINHIEAQRGQKLTDEEADLLIAATMDIIAAIQSSS